MGQERPVEASFDDALQALVVELWKVESSGSVSHGSSLLGQVSALLVLRGRASRASSQPGVALAAADAALLLTPPATATSTSGQGMRTCEQKMPMRVSGKNRGRYNQPVDV